MSETREQIIQKIYDAPENMESKNRIIRMLEVISAVGYVVIPATTWISSADPDAKRKPNCF